VPVGSSVKFSSLPVGSFGAPEGFSRNDSDFWGVMGVFLGGQKGLFTVELGHFLIKLSGLKV
jgi:hypothetical protein